ncbi:YcaO-like family protein [Erwiniaceae bacterium L1_55_4]|nr:YcaO-like family protein [Erwiniaceae bacterium L1_55_4]
MNKNSISIRHFNEKEVLKLSLPYRSTLGISRITSVGEFLNIPGVYIVNAIRTNLKSGQISSTQGKGLTLKSAACGALMEAYERHCACWNGNTILKNKISESDASVLTSLGYSRKSIVSDWTRAYDWFSGEEIHIPSLEVNFPYDGIDLKKTNINAHTSGLASGGTKEEATCFSILESIERNASSYFFKHCLSEICADYVDLSTVTKKTTVALLSNLFSKGYQCFALKVHSPIPVFYVALYDPDNMGPKFMTAGTASGFTDSEALESALMEAIQGLVVSLQASREDLSRHKKKYQEQDFFKNSKFNQLDNLFSNHYKRISMPLSESFVLNMQAAFDFIKKALINLSVRNVYLVDLSLKDTPFYTIKSIIPQLPDLLVNPQREIYK